jgi:hypothetical protein
MTYWVGSAVFSLGETPTVPWRQRDAIADLGIAHGRTSLHWGEYERVVAARPRIRLSPSEGERQENRIFGLYQR